MGERKRTMKLVKKVLKDETVQHLYTDEELTYMNMQLNLMRAQRAAKKLQSKKDKGFGYSL